MLILSLRIVERRRGCSAALGMLGFVLQSEKLALEALPSVLAERVV
jgi:hypothetical protein